MFLNNQFVNFYILRYKMDFARDLTVNKMNNPVSNTDSKLGRRERNKLEKLSRIIGATRGLFASQGFDKTTTLQIAEAANIGVGTLFLYARTKEDLLFMVFKDEMLEAAELAFKNCNKNNPLIENVMMVFTRMIDYHERDLSLTRIILREITIPGTEQRINDLRALTDVIFSGLAKLASQAQAKGELSSDKLALSIARSLFATYYFELIGWVGGVNSREDFMINLHNQLSVIINNKQCD